MHRRGTDFSIFASLANRLGFEPTFTERRSKLEWLQHLYEQAAAANHASGIEVPASETFWQEGFAELPKQETPHVALREFSDDPATNPLSTPSGRIEIASKRIA